MAKTVLFHELGGPEVLTLADREPRAPGKGEVALRVQAFGLNRAESMLRSGTYYYQPRLPEARLGYEAAGVVEAVGEGVEGFAPGDEVITTSGLLMEDHGVYGEHAVVPAATALLHRPAGLEPVTAAAIPLTYMTAYGALIHRARVQPGDTVLITAGAGGVGLAAIQMVRTAGAVPIVTTRRAAKRQRLLDAGAAEVIVTEDEDVLKRVRELTADRGADVVFDPLGGSFLHTAAAALAPGGLLIVYGWLLGEENPLPYTWPLELFTYANTYLTDHPDRLRRAGAYLEAGLRGGWLAPVIDRTFPLDDIVEAHRLLDSNEHVGKIVVTVD
ncbi:zinc-dependent alcohol dehydrogenase family protein [Streptomyces sp. A7024]|uniref:Zinc-dependent alcohol dehydrogenase family protein n=1 Tax=Streptomyces coryli TaxID=1128680 RepID=A0A6G4TU51_9ACTN|nr:zinc-dependent alcohol dehydrogenase family protein [Streptomyces coryli]NGN63549.1 zinc-dependent alcohol dehydrogenase family protein [Streptomyces coryli]